MVDIGQIEVEVAYALPERQTIIALSVRTGASVGEVIQISGILEQHPEIDMRTNYVGVFGKRVQTDSLVSLGDRVEIYRRLMVDPKQARRARIRNKTAK